MWCGVREIDRERSSRRRRREVKALRSLSRNAHGGSATAAGRIWWDIGQNGPDSEP